jgi:AAA+ superfamily predicted ATPase
MTPQHAFSILPIVRSFHCSSGLAEEVLRRVESGRFAVNAQILDLYATALSRVRGSQVINESHAKSLLRDLWRIHGDARNNQLDPSLIQGAANSLMAHGPSSAAPYGMSSNAASNGGRGVAIGSIFGDAGPPSQRYAAGGGGGATSAGGSMGGGGYGGSGIGSYSGGGGAYGGGGGGGNGGRGNGSFFDRFRPGGGGAQDEYINGIKLPIRVAIEGGPSLLRLIFMRIVSAVILVCAFQYLTKEMMGGKDGPKGMLSQLAGEAGEEITEIPTTRFSDVKGVDEAKGELEDVVNFLRDPQKYRRLGAKVPKGVLLTGPPGTGKTLLARAVAGEAGCKFYAKSASEFEEMLVGLGASRVRALFAAARKNSPAIIFIDEIDAMGGKRKTSFGSGAERQTLNQLLACMDGFTKGENVIVIAATNSPEILDPALVRPGRFDTTVDVPLPDVKGRKAIIDLYLQKIVVSPGKGGKPSIDSELLAKATPGFSGAQIEAMINSAALLAANRGADHVEMQDMEEARDKVIMGELLDR